MQKDICSLIEKRLIFNFPNCSLSDHASHFGIYEEIPEGATHFISPFEPGISHFLVFYNRLFKELSNSLARLYLYSIDEAKFIPINNLEVRFHPYGITQSLKIDQIKVEATIVFTQTNSLNLSVSLSTVKRPMALKPIIQGSLKSGLAILSEYDEDQAILMFQLEIPRLDARDPEESFRVYGELKHNFEVEKVTLKETLTPQEALEAVPNLNFTAKDALSYALVGKAIKLEPDKPQYLSVDLRFWIDDYQPPEFTGIKNPVKTARKRWNDTLRKAPQPPTEDPVLKSLYYHAYQVLLNNLYAPIGPLYKGHHASFLGKGGYDAQWLLDTAFHSFGILRLNQRLACDMLEILLENQHEDGKDIFFLAATWERTCPATQPPLAGLAYWRYYIKTNDKGFLSRAYSGLGRSVEWWLKNMDPDGDGLCEYYVARPDYKTPTLVGKAGMLCHGLWENSPRWNKGKAEAIDLNSFLLIDYRLLSQMALELGLKDESKEWIMKAGRLSQRILELMYDEKTNLFYDLLPSHKFSRVLTPACFLPLWAGVKIEENKARAMIEKYLLNPEHFYGKIPFPTVAYSEPSYQHDTFWRGPLWPGIAYFMLQILGQYGYEQEADEAASRLLQMATKEPYIFELYDSRSGVGMGHISYGWTADIIIEMILKSYKEPII